MNWTDFTVVFDLDGTLVDTAPDLHAALVHCFSEKGLPAVTLDTIRHAIGHGARVMIETCANETGTDLTEDELSAMHKSFLSYYIAHIA
ncbi:MAG TPA: phosphoglycolate phosphatase, partial [Hyphomonadaceae bacterium]|nr:phosphoglycolate phosphatase [Hyphomonadaceae bacterium]